MIVARTAPVDGSIEATARFSLLHAPQSVRYIGRRFRWSTPKPCRKVISGGSWIDEAPPPFTASDDIVRKL